MTADGRRLGWEDFKTYLDPTTGKLKPDVVRIKYSDRQGGQITSETRFSVKLEKGSGPRDWVLDERPVDTLDWQFLIRPVGDQKKLNAGFQATYELVNDSPPISKSRAGKDRTEPLFQPPKNSSLSPLPNRNSKPSRFME
jgi:hypothetical protein